MRKLQWARCRCQRSWPVLVLVGSILAGIAQARPAEQNSRGADDQPAKAVRLPDFSAVIARVRSSVVAISVRRQAVPDSDEDDDQGRSAPSFPFDLSPFIQALPRLAEVRGSGFITGADGIIVTNDHVITKAATITVTLDDGTVLPARMLSHDVRSDIALLKVDARKPLPPVAFTNTSVGKPGEWVITMGDPFGLGGTATVGIVSAVGRNIGVGPDDRFIQVDAPINQGDSGGPLFNQDRQVIGMMTAILSPSGGSIGIGFAIPSAIVAPIVAELEATGHVVRGYAGMVVQELTPALANALHLPDMSGALVAAVEPYGPAARAGMKTGDVVRALNGKHLQTSRELAAAIMGLKPGEQVTLDIIRGGKNQVITIGIIQMPEEPERRPPAPRPEPEEELGLTFETLSAMLAEQLGLPAGTTGAVITQVAIDSPGETAGLRVGDVVAGIGTQPVTNATEAARAIRAAGQQGDAILFRIIRNGDAIFVAVSPSDPARKG